MQTIMLLFTIANIQCDDDTDLMVNTWVNLGAERSPEEKSKEEHSSTQQMEEKASAVICVNVFWITLIVFIVEHNELRVIWNLSLNICNLIKSLRLNNAACLCSSIS